MSSENKNGKLSSVNTGQFDFYTQSH